MEKSKYFETGLNCFGYKRYSPLIIFTEPYNSLRKKIREDAVKYLFAEKGQIFDAIEDICREEIESNAHKVKSFELELKVEKRLHFSQNQNGFIENRVKERCYRIKKQLLAGLEDLEIYPRSTDKLIDVGAGSGLNVHLVKNELDLNYVLLADVVDYRYPEVRNSRGIDFSLLKAPFDHIDTQEKFQLGVITNTLHHCDQPFTVFNALKQCLDKDAILLVIESCIGVQLAELKDYAHSAIIPYQTIYTLGGQIQPDQMAYMDLSDEYKMIYGIFFDWLYNRVFLNENINVPYNFGTPADWNNQFEQMGFEVLKTHLLGFDQPAALEFHTLHLLKLKG